MPSVFLRLMDRREPHLPEPPCAQLLGWLLLLQGLELGPSLAGGGAVHPAHPHPAASLHLDRAPAVLHGGGKVLLARTDGDRLPP